MKVIVTPHLGIELTQRCNLNCSHCFRGEDRNIDILKSILEKVFEEIKYVQTLDLSGGEVFLGYEQLKMLLEIAKERNVTIKYCSMLTNGTVYDSRIYELLDEQFGTNYQVGISDDDFHDKSIRRIYGKNENDSKNPELHPLSTNDVKNNMRKHFLNEHCIGFQRVSNRLINNGRAVNLQTPHKDFEAMGYYYSESKPNVLLVGPMIFIGADGFVSDINSNFDRRKEQSLGNISERNLSDLILNGGIKIECTDIEEFFLLMEKREDDFATHQGEHLGFKDGRMEHIEYKKDESYYEALEDLPDFIDRAFRAIESGKLTEFLEDNHNFSIYPRDLSQIDHESGIEER